MISFIKGKVVEIKANSIIIECNNMGYEIFCTINTLSNVKFNNEVQIFTYMAVKEDGITLYGFLKTIERDMFLKLITVSGVGPKGAMSILGGATTEELALAIMRKDADFLSSFKGVGKKTAERIVLELREKVDNIAINQMSKQFENEDFSIIAEATTALSSLGISNFDSAKLVRENYKENITIEELLTICLKAMGK